jgi:hypothetical protein
MCLDVERNKKERNREERRSKDEGDKLSRNFV